MLFDAISAYAAPKSFERLSNIIVASHIQPHDHIPLPRPMPSEKLSGTFETCRTFRQTSKPEPFLLSILGISYYDSRLQRNSRVPFTSKNDIIEV